MSIFVARQYHVSGNSPLHPLPSHRCYPHVPRDMECKYLGDVGLDMYGTWYVGDSRQGVMEQELEFKNWRGMW